MTALIAFENENFLIFQLQVERSRGSFGDDTAVNNIRFKCRTMREYREHVLSTKGTPWGEWGHWSENCPVGTAICGIQVNCLMKLFNDFLKHIQGYIFVWGLGTGHWRAS